MGRKKKGGEGGCVGKEADEPNTSAPPPLSPLFPPVHPPNLQHHCLLKLLFRKSLLVKTAPLFSDLAHVPGLDLAVVPALLGKARREGAPGLPRLQIVLVHDPALRQKRRTGESAQAKAQRPSHARREGERRGRKARGGVKGRKTGKLQFSRRRVLRKHQNAARGGRVRYAGVLSQRSGAF